MLFLFYVWLSFKNWDFLFICFFGIISNTQTNLLANFCLQITGPNRPQFRQSIDTAQLHQSRLGLVSQAIMLIITVCFILSEILGEFWKKKVPLESRNIFDVVFRVVELGVALWFPCVLWNCMRYILIILCFSSLTTTERYVSMIALNNCGS